MESVVNNELRRFFRNARRQPGFTCAVIAILALGISVNAVVFSVVDALVLDPFPFPEPERLLVVGTAMPRLARPLGYFERLSGPEIADLEARLETLEHLLSFDLNSVRARGENFPRRLFAGFFWADPFTTLGVEPLHGRGFRAAEINAELAVAARAIEAEHGAASDEYRDWRLEAVTWNRFSSFSYRNEALLTLGAVLFVLILVCANLANLLLVRAAGRRQESAVRLALGASRRRLFGQALGESAFFALAGGASGVLLAGWGIEVAGAQLPGVLQPAGRGLVLDTRVLGFSTLITMLAALGIYGVVTFSVAGRRREMGLRLALGATRRDIVRLVLRETLTTAMLGTVAGLTAAWGLGRLLAGSFGELEQIDPLILAAAAVALVLAALLAGTAPAGKAARVGPAEVLREV